MDLLKGWQGRTWRARVAPVPRVMHKERLFGEKKGKTDRSSGGK